MPSVTELFAPPDDIREIQVRPFEEWSEEDYRRIFLWLHEQPRRSYLRDIAARTALISGSIGAEGTAGLVDDFYATRLNHLLRRAQHKNFGALLLVEFDKFLWRAYTGAAAGGSAYSERGDRLTPAIPARSETIGPSAPRPRLSPLQRLMALWHPGAAPATMQDSGEGDRVETSVFGPRKVAQGRHFMLQAFAHTREQAEEARRLAREFDEEATARLGIRTLGVRLSPGTRLTYRLALPGLAIVEPVQEIFWQRHTENVAFGVEVPPEYRVGNVIGTVTVVADGVPIGRITIKIEIKPAGKAMSAQMDALDAVTTAARLYERAFISYASQDRNTVVRMLQTLRLNGITFFQDLLNLEPGDRWAKQLYRYIDDCDLFLLFWSSHAKASEWVMKEVRYAIERRAGDDEAPPAIHPVIIEGPPPVPPPPELEHLHFNDPLIYFRDREAPPA